ncbi:MAG: DUF523 domain-containing protein [Myxococcota bacterium]|nr:DUF523 domain-containing protein [Myxococcota bacterium]
MSRVVVSACLLGRPCRYDGGQKAHSAVQAWVEKQRATGHEVLALCPEELGGLGTPRRPADLRGGAGQQVLAGEAQVVDDQGRDVTEAFLDGARLAATEAKGAQIAVLKARSPSCGCGETRIEGELLPGDGVFAALLRRQGVRVSTEEQLGEQ